MDVVLHTRQSLDSSSRGTTSLGPEGSSSGWTWCFTRVKALILRRGAPRRWVHEAHRSPADLSRATQGKNCTDLQSPIDDEIADRCSFLFRYMLFGFIGILGISYKCNCRSCHESRAHNDEEVRSHAAGGWKRVRILWGKFPGSGELHISVVVGIFGSSLFSRGF